MAFNQDLPLDSLKLKPCLPLIFFPPLRGLLPLSRSPEAGPTHPAPSWLLPDLWTHPMAWSWSEVSFTSTNILWVSTMCQAFSWVMRTRGHKSKEGTGFIFKEQQLSEHPASSGGHKRITIKHQDYLSGGPPPHTHTLYSATHVGGTPNFTLQPSHHPIYACTSELL